MEDTQDDEYWHDGNNLRNRAGEKVRELSAAARSQAGERVRKLSETAKERAQVQMESQRERIAGRVENAATSLRQHAEAGENLRFLAERRVAHGLENAAGYLHSHQTNEVAGDAVSYVRQHPLRSLVMAAVIGYLLGKLLG